MHFVETLDSNSSTAFGVCLISATFFVLSILLCLLGMSEAPPSVGFASVYFAVLFFAVGTLLVFFLVNISRKSLIQRPTAH